MKDLDNAIFPVPAEYGSVHLGVKDGQIKRNLISGGSPGRVLSWAQHLDGVGKFPDKVLNHEDGILAILNYVNELSKAGVIELVLANRLQVVLNGTFSKEEMTLGNTYMGASTTGINMFEFARYGSVRDLLWLRGGTSGIMLPDISIEDTIISRDVEYTNDGVSDDIYFPDMFPSQKFMGIPSPDVSQMLEVVSKEYCSGSRRVHAARTKTVRELFRTNEKYREILADPAQIAVYQLQTGEYPLPAAISMEFSIYLAVMAYLNEKKGYKIKAGQSLIGSDPVCPYPIGNLADARKEYGMHAYELELNQGLILMETARRLRQS
ncbi:MAG: hypothetical protein ABIJ34_02635 [archaeon]